MSHQLAALPGLTVFASQGNFVLVKLPEGRDGGRLRDYLIKEHGVFVRECGNSWGRRAGSSAWWSGRRTMCGGC